MWPSGCVRKGARREGAHARVYRPWGFFRTVHGGERLQVKIITVNPGAALSLQRHRHRAEHWVVVNGDRNFVLRKNEATNIPPLRVHRLTNPRKEPLALIEIQTGSYLGEDDIERFEDNYGRACKSVAATAGANEAEIPGL